MNNTFLSIITFSGLALLALALVYGEPDTPLSAGGNAVIPAEGVELPVTWGDMGARLVAVGVIDEEKFRELYRARGGLSTEEEALLTGRLEGKLRITPENAGYLLNLLWAFGLANENPILTDTSEMMRPSYGGAGNFASTGGWTLARGPTMEHYGKHRLVELTEAQQALVDRVSRGIYRPCCGNSTHFPDCNHGMAMLGLLELMAAQGLDEDELYRAALAVNSYWFPQTYLTIAEYMRSRGIAWKDVSPREVLGRDYSSASGYADISSRVAPQAGPQGGGCSA